MQSSSKLCLTATEIVILLGFHFTLSYYFPYLDVFMGLIIFLTVFRFVIDAFQGKRQADKLQMDKWGSLIPDTKENRKQAMKSRVSDAWYLVPFFFSILGGIIGYVATKERDSKKAKYILGFGFIIFVIEVIIIIL